MSQENRGISQAASSESKAKRNAASIKYWDRREGCEKEEKIYAGRALRWLYGPGCNRALAAAVFSRPWLSRLVGIYQSTRWSRRRIHSFITEFAIPIAEFEQATYRSFNDFFVRRFRPGARAFTTDPTELPAFAEGRYLACAELGARDRLPVKGDSLDAARLLGSAAEAAPFCGGPVLIARLCPVDYHRFHYPDGGTTLRSWRAHGRLHSVHPIALSAVRDVLATNQRQVSVLSTDNFGLLAYVEVGALNVGRIVQSHALDKPFGRGDEKGYFLFGGSTVVVLGEPGRWIPDSDLRERTASGQEVLVRLGERVARRA